MLGKKFGYISLFLIVALFTVQILTTEDQQEAENIAETQETVEEIAVEGQEEQIPEEQEEEFSFVKKLTDANFSEYLNENEFTMVKFFAPWCGHCKALAPEYLKAAEQIYETFTTIRFAEVDCTEAQTVCGEQAVQGYPTVKLFNGDKFLTNYEEDRTADALIKFVKKKSGNAISQLTTKEEIDQIIEQQSVIAIYFGSDEQKMKLIATSGLTLEDLELAQVKNSELFADFKVESSEALVIFKKFDEKRNDFEGEFTEESLVQFFTEKAIESVEQFSMKVVKKTFQSSKPFILLFDKDKNTPLYETFSEAANTLKSEIVVSYSEIKEIGQKLAEIIGVEETDLPTIRIIHPNESDLKKYILEEEFTKENIINFYEEFKAGNLKQSLKSENIVDNTDLLVKTFVGKNYESDVLESNFDVLVKYYAPWCGHCKALAPIFEEVALKLKMAGNTNIVIGELDATKNDTPGLQIQGYPTIKFYSAKNKGEPMDYNGEREVYSFLDFLKENTSFDWIDIPGHGQQETEDLEKIEREVLEQMERELEQQEAEKQEEVQEEVQEEAQEEVEQEIEQEVVKEDL